MRNLVTISVLLAAGSAHADVSAAARAFTDGQAAQLDGDYDRAARSFELAFSIAPAKEALRSAVRAHVQAGHWPRAATLAALLLEKYGSDPMSAQLANEVIVAAGPKLGRIAVTCAAVCTLAIDGRSVSPTAAARHVVYVMPGHQALAITFEGDRGVTREGEVSAGGELVYEIERPVAPAPVAPPPPPAAPAPEPPPVHHTAHHGLSPVVPIVGGAVTLALGGLAVWSGRDTLDAHHAYVAAPTPEGWSDGRSKQLRTNVLIGSACGVGATTLLVAVLWTRWRGDRRVAIAPNAHGGTLVLGGTF